jgi:hypothetical protein
VRRETFQFVDDVLTLPVLSETLVRRSDAAR